jgi:tetratricopeptide (TPR) repeat protein
MPGRFANLEFNDENRQNDLSLETKRSDQHDERAYLAQAIEAAHWGRFENALRLYTRCLESNRAVVPAWVGQIQMLVELSEYNEARLWSDKALELFRNNGELLAAKAQACARLKDVPAAMACSDGSLQAPGSSPWRWQARGEALLAAGQNYFDECFQKSLTEKGADWFDRVMIARIYLYYRRATNALYYLKQATELDPAQGYVWFEMGSCQAALGLTGAARTCYQRCLELRPDYREARTALDKLQSLSFTDWLKGRFFGRVRK